MDRPQHGFDRSASHTNNEMTCTCGSKDCSIADQEWMDWAEIKVARLQAAIDEFCRQSAWCADAWKRQPHISDIFDLESNN